MTGQLDGRVAVITGGADGIGRGLVKAFAAEGARVLVADIDADQGEVLADELGSDVIFRSTDVRQKDQVEAMIGAAAEQWGTLDVLVNNAWGGGRIGRIEAKTPDLMEAGMAVGFYGPLWAMNAAHSIMKANNYGRIVNMCSLNGVNAHIGTAEYNSAKEALRAATRTAAREWAPLGITANVICPAAKSASFRAVMSEHPELEAAADASNPMGRIGDAEADIAPVALFLASEGCRYMTGNTLFVDGGSHINGSSWAPDLD